MGQLGVTVCLSTLWNYTVSSNKSLTQIVDVNRSTAHCVPKDLFSEVFFYICNYNLEIIVCQLLHYKLGTIKRTLHRIFKKHNQNCRLNQRFLVDLAKFDKF